MPAFTAWLDTVLAEPFSRLLDVVDDPVERRTLAPLVVEELVFRLLRSDAGAAMRGAICAGDARPIAEAMRLMRMQAVRPLSVDAIARQVAMSPSHFAHRFRVIARMIESPAHFAGDFKRRFGAPPTRYARRLRSGRYTSPRRGPGRGREDVTYW